MVNATPIDLSSIASLEPLVAPVKNLVGTLEVVLGGIFGLYLIFAVIQAYYAKRKDKLLREILGELRNVSSSLGSPKKTNKR